LDAPVVDDDDDDDGRPPVPVDPIPLTHVYEDLHGRPYGRGGGGRHGRVPTAMPEYDQVFQGF
jgi:hypothetical protein